VPDESVTHTFVPHTSIFGPHAQSVTPWVLVKQRSPLRHRGARSPHVACAVPFRTSDCAHAWQSVFTWSLHERTVGPTLSVQKTSGPASLGVPPLAHERSASESTRRMHVL
jgi:hypothetical protein